MDAGFSEFSYGFALSFEIMNTIDEIQGAPLLPSLVKEAKLGYDVSFKEAGWPLFLQFKLADYLKGGRSKYRSEYGGPYWRLRIRSVQTSNQHNLLRQLAAVEPEVYYAAPEFRKTEDFHEAFRNSEVFLRSIFIPLTDLDYIADDEEHEITFVPGVQGFDWHSHNDNHHETNIDARAWLHRLQERLERPRPADISYFRELRRSLVLIVRENDQQSRLFESTLAEKDDDPPVMVIRDLRFLLHSYFGVEPLLLRRRNRELFRETRLTSS